jgi:hypothetical protein
MIHANTASGEKVVGVMQCVRVVKQIVRKVTLSF